MDFGSYVLKVCESWNVCVRKCVDRESRRDLKKIKLNCGISIWKMILESKRFSNELNLRQFGILRSIDSRTRRFQESH